MSSSGAEAKTPLNAPKPTHIRRTHPIINAINNNSKIDTLKRLATLMPFERICLKVLFIPSLEKFMLFPFVNKPKTRRFQVVLYNILMLIIPSTYKIKYHRY